jgi:hypothetical protein
VQGGRVHEGLETGEFDRGQAHAVINGSSVMPARPGDKALCQTRGGAAMHSCVLYYLNNAIYIIVIY